MPITSEKRLKELSSIYTEITADHTNKIEAAKKVFDKIIKQVPPTQKKFKTKYDKKIIFIMWQKNEFRWKK